MELLYSAAQGKAHEVFETGRSDKHFTLTVFRELTSDANTRHLYEQLIEADAYTDGAPKKVPLNMYLGWHIKKAINAQRSMPGDYWMIRESHAARSSRGSQSEATRCSKARRLVLLIWLQPCRRFE